MPIRINLLAEAQALEDMRRRDPVKRAILVGLVLAGLVLAYSSSIQLKSMIVKGDLSRMEGEIAANDTKYQAVLANQKKLALLNHRMSSLQQLTTNRLLHGSVLNALQKVAMPTIHFNRFRTEQSYLYSEAVKAKTNGSKIIPPVPSRVTENILLSMEARDTGPGQGDQVNVFRQAVTNSSFFYKPPGEVKLASLSPPQIGPDGKPFVLFTLECRYPELVR